MRLGSEVLAADLYDILQVPETATHEQIKRAWRRLAMQSHPDLAGGDRQAAEQRMARINVAANVLLDPMKRAVYDQHRRPLWPRAPEPVTHEQPLEWERPEPERKSWVPSSAELAALLALIRPWTGRTLLELSETVRGWPARRHAATLAVCVVMAVCLILQARPRSLAFLYGKPPALGVASPKGS